VNILVQVAMDQICKWQINLKSYLAHSLKSGLKIIYADLGLFVMWIMSLEAIEYDFRENLFKTFAEVFCKVLKNDRNFCFKLELIYKFSLPLMLLLEKEVKFFCLVNLMDLIWKLRLKRSFFARYKLPDFVKVNTHPMFWNLKYALWGSSGSSWCFK